MRRRLGVLIVVASALLGGPLQASAAMQVTLTVSPTTACVGQPVEVLLRTYVPIGWEDLGLEPPQPWPFAPGLAYVLWPFPDYPFMVVAQGDGGPDVEVALSPDPTDPTFWRGTLVPDRVGTWRVRVTNFGNDDPGATVAFEVASRLPSGPSSADSGSRPIMHATCQTV